MILLVIVCAGSTGRADPELAARAHYQLGETLYQSGRYREARAEFVAGFELSHKPTFVFNAAECSRLAGDLDTARQDYARYLQLDPSGKHAVLARARLDAIAGTTPWPAKSPDPTPAAAPPVAPSAQTPSPVVTPPPAVATPSVVLQHVSQPQPSQVTGIATFVVEPSPPIWHRKSVWIGIGVGAALVAGSVAIYAATRHHDTMCTPPNCVVVP
jgi:tetratricopeptide (TPR) repeat protein